MCFVSLTRWRDGTTAIILTPTTLLERLCPLIPAPYTHSVRYHGVFAPAAKLRPLVVEAAEPHRPKGDETPLSATRRILWAQLMKRTFGIDVLKCRRCGGRLRPIALIIHPPVVRAIIDSTEILDSSLGPAPPEAFDDRPANAA